MKMSESLILVTGASGFVASHVIKQLQEEGHIVRVTVRDAKNEKKVNDLLNLCPDPKFPLEVVEADLLNADSWPKAVEGCTYVLHTASPFPLYNPKTADELIKPAVDGTLNVLKACAEAKTVKRVVLTSSVQAIGTAASAKKESFSEDDFVPEDDIKDNFYATSKVRAEKAAWKFVEDLPDGEKFELSVVNPSFILGPVLHDAAGSSINTMRQLLERSMPLVPPINFTLCDVRDVATAQVKCMTLPEAAGKRHIIGNDRKWLKGFAEILDKEFKPQGYNVPTKEVPGFVASIVKHFNSDLKGLLKDFGGELVFDNTRMRDVLQINPFTAEKTLIDMAYSMIEKGLVKKTKDYISPSGEPSQGLTAKSEG